jgi:hypothetical protein
LDKNFNTAHLKLKNMLMELSLKGCPAEGCELANNAMTYQAVMKHLTLECKKVKGSCS